MAVDVGFILLLPLPPSPSTAPARSQLRLSTNTRPSPLQRDVGRFDLAQLGDMKGGTQGETQEVGGPAGASRQRATTFVVARFRHSFFYLPPLTTGAAQRRRPTTHDDEGTRTPQYGGQRPIFDTTGRRGHAHAEVGQLKTTRRAQTTRRRAPPRRKRPHDDSAPPRCTKYNPGIGQPTTMRAAERGVGS